MKTCICELSSQIFGHVGMRTMRDGSLIVKPAFPSELHFYRTLAQNPHLAPLRPFIPRFLGTVEQNDDDDACSSSQWSDSSLPPGRTEFLLMENLCHSFSKPNIIDIKLGTVFYDEDTSPDKVLRMEKTARETTSLETGVRLAEFQVYDNVTSEAIRTPKSYGKAMDASELQDGIARFFPVFEPPRSRGRSNVGLPRRTLVPILRAVRKDVEKIREAYSSVEMRMVGASLLIVYEADWNRADEGMKRIQSLAEEHAGEGKSVKRPPYVVKLIDFAHTRLTPGRGPDDGVLLGLDTMLKLLDVRIHQLVEGE
ncbi:Inositol polyphosphate multikinase [Hypsizygus marmoreus]|uniref:Kinase n=1 Tax=Hypsizygus marmoreus TaxID=39966 RepID=A0A369JDN1_HYPMA|nr:Inositol polyphosphate multikinase [Hypsizygus marmoreus]